VRVDWESVLEELDRARTELSEAAAPHPAANDAASLRSELVRLKSVLHRKQALLREWREARGLQFEEYAGAFAGPDPGTPARWEA
jgi:hypothetical protein